MAGYVVLGIVIVTLIVALVVAVRLAVKASAPAAAVEAEADCAEAKVDAAAVVAAADAEQEAADEATRARANADRSRPAIEVLLDELKRPVPLLLIGLLLVGRIAAAQVALPTPCIEQTDGFVRCSKPTMELIKLHQIKLRESAETWQHAAVAAEKKLVALQAELTTCGAACDARVTAIEASARPWWVLPAVGVGGVVVGAVVVVVLVVASGH